MYYPRPLEFAVVDIETSGGKPKDSKVIEIAIIIHDGHQIVDKYESLVNPEKPIDWYVTKLTGIKNADVANAPKFFEIAKTVFQMLEGRVFVAHNVGFDYPIIRNEFKSLGFDLRLPHLCTIQSSRQIMPGLESYGLKKVSEHLQITLDQHHRAMDDTLATAEILKHLFNTDKQKLETFVKEDINPKKLHEKLDLNDLDELPNKTGVYAFYNEKNEIIYIGKSLRIKSRVEQHLKQAKTNKAIEMRPQIARIKYLLTGSELVALLLESKLIKKHQPIYNKSQKNIHFNYGLYDFVDNNGYRQLLVKKRTKTGQPIHTFTSLANGKKRLEQWAEDNQLCRKLCQLDPGQGACFDYSIKACDGACIGKESPEHYNQKVNDLINGLQFNQESFLIIDKGVKKNEISFIHIDKGRFAGYGYMFKYTFLKRPENFRKYITKQEHLTDYISIINSHLKKNESIELFKLP